MVVGLDGIEKLLLAIDPATRVEIPFACRGYINTGVYNKGKLVEIYGPIAKNTPSYTLEQLQHVAAEHNYVIKSYVRAPDIPPFEPPKLFKPKRG